MGPAGIGVLVALLATAALGAALVVGVDDEPAATAVGDHPGTQLLSNLVPDPEGTGFHGALLDEPIPRPTFTLTATDGQPYDFAEKTRGRPTLLYVGYTHCPDVCPTHLGHIAGAMDELDWTGEELEVAFVTADPARDDVDTLASYLDRFHPSLTGLTGSEADVANALGALGLPPPARYNERDGGSDEVSHPSQVIAFGPDDEARLVFPFGTSLEGWTEDLPRLVDGEVPR